jgi:ATP-dependent helicase HrpB
VREEWLHQFFKSNWAVDSSLIWNPVRQTVDEVTSRTCLGVVIEQRIDAPRNTHAAGEVLAEAIIQQGLALDGWSCEVNEWIARVRWLSELAPGQHLAIMNDEERRLVIHELCRGQTRYADVKGRPVLPLVRELYSPQQLHTIDTLAPPSIVLASGRRLRVQYTPGQPPHIRARIQEIYDLRSTPRIADGNAPVVIEILAPNMRPVQITNDLASFWERHYPAIKPALARRYPKHEWR